MSAPGSSHVHPVLDFGRPGRVNAGSPVVTKVPSGGGVVCWGGWGQGCVGALYFPPSIVVNLKLL